ncbi:VOC family protein [Glaciihabitans arcticus]|uniref:VOC family protein n=1 Tax=Glaciihabitans arcticus TaxID=2668039 RepID=A0A4Q9GR52_9MICO|nr:VOC family protein [Glaciihabitans arcticus]TBN56524.1 VOC family protein [Glaciihabitans arcticus]
MFTPTGSFGGFSVRDVDEAYAFYTEKLGLTVDKNDMGILDISLPGGGVVIAYPKGDDHVPASFTILNFEVADIDEAVDALNERGIVTKIYDEDSEVPWTDEKGIGRGKANNSGPDIAWFKDPSGNILSVICG